jgi:ribulose-phosphate 3-epimerase
MHKKILSASILSADFSCLSDQIKLAETAGVDWIHVDVMDGAFVPTITMGPFIVEACRRITRLPIDVHLMINEPARHISDFIKAGANYLTIHIENCPNIHRDLLHIKSLNCKAGVALNPGTPASSVTSVLNEADMVLIMSVDPGSSGQMFIPQTYDKIKQIRNYLDKVNSGAVIEVDGGINPANIRSLKDAGVDAFVAATAIFRTAEGIPTAVKSLKSALK